MTGTVADVSRVETSRRSSWGMSKLWEGQTLKDKAAHKSLDPSASW